MLTRRSLLFLAASGTALLAAAPFGRAQAQAMDPAQAEAFVRQVGSQLVAVVNGPGSLAEKQRRLQPLIDQAVAVPEIARFCLGRFWRVASQQQQQDYLSLFHEVLLRNITGRLGEYQGVRFTVQRAEPRAGGTVVETVVSRPNSAPANVGWVVQPVGGQPKIVDVVAEGTSLRLTQRSDYASFLSRNGDNVQTLIDAMKRQLSA